MRYGSVRLAMWPISEGSISIVGTLAPRLWNMRFSEMIEYLEETKTKENDRCSESHTSKKLSKVSGKREHEVEEYRQIADYSQESIQNSRFANNCQEVGRCSEQINSETGRFNSESVKRPVHKTLQ
jgi:FtsZ-interacting cell division protein ZipA